MTVLSDKWIKKMAKSNKMIAPFVPKQVRKGKISFGLSSYGYDARVSNDFKVFTNVNSAVVDPKNFKKDSFTPWTVAPVPAEIIFFEILLNQKNKIQRFRLVYFSLIC